MASFSTSKSVCQVSRALAVHVVRVDQATALQFAQHARGALGVQPGAVVAVADVAGVHSPVVHDHMYTVLACSRVMVLLLVLRAMVASLGL